jgi:hypothetical protein
VSRHQVSPRSSSLSMASLLQMVSPSHTQSFYLVRAFKN